MKFNIRGDKMKTTQAIDDYIIAKIGKLDKYLEDPENTTATVVVKVHGAKQKVEVTININKVIFRAEEEHKDLYATIDLVSEKLERQIKKNKTKKNKSKQAGVMKKFMVNLGLNKEEIKKPEITKRREIEMKPMNEEEAILQLKLSNQDFFVYKDEFTNKICIIYKRKDKNYEIIITN